MSSSLNDIADSLKNPDLNALLKNIRTVIISHAQNVGEKEAKSILESRFMPAQEAYDQGIISCGAMTNMATSMLKHLGYQVKLVHGEIPQTSTHAWLSIKDKNRDEWKQYDVTRDDCLVTSDYKTKYIVNDWKEIKLELEKFI